MKINKVYPSFYNGITEQPPELALDTQCKDMINCIPSIVDGVSKRPPIEYVTSDTDINMRQKGKIFHVYDRGEDDEEYIFVYRGDATTPISIYSKSGVAMTVNYEGDATTIARLKAFLLYSTALTYSDGWSISSSSNVGDMKLKGLTVQDRTFIINKGSNVVVDSTQVTASNTNYDKTAYYWLKRGSGDKYNPYRYAVYLNGVTYETTPTIPDTTDTAPGQGHEITTIAAEALKDQINGVAGFACVREGSILKIYQTNGSDFTFSSWDSWGNQASEGWKGSVNKITDLPQDFPWIDTYVTITGSETNSFTDYYVKWNGSSWQETRNPTQSWGYLAGGMPIAVDRTGVNTFTVRQLSWEVPEVGNLDNNPLPSFIGSNITDIFFYKNRLGLASNDSIVLSQVGGYYDFYIKTALDILDTDPIDVSIASNKASKIYHVKPFQNSLFIFTKDSQFQMTSEGFTSPKTVSISNVTNYPMSVNVEPRIINNSLFFISVSNNKQQLREYIKDEQTLSVKGIDLNITTPNLLNEPINKIAINGVLGYVILSTSNKTMYLYNFKDTGTDRVQSAWSKWEILTDMSIVADTVETDILDNSLLIACKTTEAYIYHTMDLTKDGATNFVDTSIGAIEYPYASSILLPDWYPHLTQIGTPKDKMLLKKVTIEGSGIFGATVYRKDYDYTFTKAYDDTSMLDLDLHINSKVGNCDITIEDASSSDFTIDSIIIEGLYRATSKEMK